MDFTTQEKQDENFPKLLDAISDAMARFRVDIVDTDEIRQLRAEFDSLWKYSPIKRDGDNALTCEKRMIWIAMTKDAGFEKRIEQCDDGRLGWMISYGDGESFFLPFGEHPEIEYRAAISALRKREDSADDAR